MKVRMTQEKMTLVEAVKDHACRHYEEGGWDYIVECYTDLQIARLIGKATTAEEAIANVERNGYIGVRADVRADIQGEADYTF